MMVFNRNLLFQGFIFRFHVTQFSGVYPFIFQPSIKAAKWRGFEKRSETAQLEQASHDQPCGRNSETTVPLPSLCQLRRLQVLGQQSQPAFFSCSCTSMIRILAYLLQAVAISQSAAPDGNDLLEPMSVGMEKAHQIRLKESLSTSK